MAEFPIPEILQAETADNIHDWMLSIIPDDIDKSEGSFVWDMTRPAAERLSYFSQFILPEAIRTAFPRYSYGVYLEQLAKAVNVNPKTATAAIGTVTVTGEAGTEIPLGSIFSTESSVATESIDFATTQAATIPESGTVDIPVECTVAGADGNVAIGTIIMKASSLPEEVTSSSPRRFRMRISASS